MTFLKNLCSAFLAGFMISLGGAVYLASESKIAGAVLFSVGLTVILISGFLLFTGKTAYLFENKPSYLGLLCLIWCGNLLGTMFSGLIVRLSKPALSEKAEELCLSKLSQTPLQTVILGALCGVLVYIAVDFFRADDDDKAFSKYLLVFTCVPAFILCGFEHSVADMFYFSASNRLYSLEGVVYILLVTVGNLIGAVAFHSLKKFVRHRFEKEK